MSHGGSTVKGGCYWKKGAWRLTLIDGNEGTLPGSEEGPYLRIPAIVLGPVALILGLSFYIFLPLFGFAIVLSAIARRIWGAPWHERPASLARRVT
jgi:hypothetical protein